jgi:hypothetical protein
VTQGKLRRHLGQRFFVRWHMTLILAGVVLAGLGASRALLALGIRSMPLRWLLVLAFAYGVFFVLVRLWMAYVASVWPAEAQAAARERNRRPGSLLDYLSSSSLDFGAAASFGEVILLLVLGLIVASLFGFAVWVVIEAPVLLAEAAFEALLASGLLPATQRLEARGWAGSLFGDTVKPFAVVAAITVGIGWAVQWMCPGVVRLADLFSGCGS